MVRAEEIVLRLNPKQFDCRIFIEQGLLEKLDEILHQFCSEKSVAIVTDSNVGPLFGDRIKKILSSGFQKVSLFEVPAGEGSKTIQSASRICDKLAKSGVDRKTPLLALGGGVVGDLTGFVASIYKRGLQYYQVPTTLLAQVDSSIGGKTGVDTSWGKNQLGTFYQPRAVLIDPLALSSLPGSEVINGAAEIVKSSIVADSEMFDRLSRTHDVLAVEDLKPLIPLTCKIKAEIVSRDEKEENLRSTLNFGHTVGHAIEASSNFSLSHGRSVILGMVAEAWIAKELELLGKDDYEACIDLLRRFRTQIPSKKTRLIIGKRKRIAELALADKKSTSGTVRMSLPEKIGKMARDEEGDYRIPVSSDLLLNSIDRVRAFISEPQAD